MRNVLCPADAKLVHQAATSHFTSRRVRGPSFPGSHTPPILPKLSTPKRWMLCAYASCQALPMLRICRSEFDKLRFAADIDPRVLTQSSRLLASCHSSRHIAVEFAFLSFSTTGILDLSWADTSSFKPQAYGGEDPSQLRLSLRASGGVDTDRLGKICGRPRLQQATHRVPNKARNSAPNELDVKQASQSPRKTGRNIAVAIPLEQCIQLLRHPPWK